MQANWIGRSEGLEVDFALDGRRDTLTVFTTRPDTLFGVSFISVAAQHPLALEAARGDARIAAFVDEASRGDVTEATLETMEKRGVPLGIHAIHPLSGEKLPVWAANFVLMGYGTGCVMAVPAHDQRDWEFARKYGLPMKAVIGPDAATAADIGAAAYTDKAVVQNSGEFSGLGFKAAFDGIAAKLEALGRGRRRVNFRLRDWSVSRQRYWGCPIPIVYCESCGAVPVPDEQLPVVLPEDLVPDGRGNPLARTPGFYECRCPSCGQPARRETDTFDTFFESSWYYARYACPDNDRAMLDERARYWLPVDQYIGGIEHAVMHLLYFRFFHKLMRDEGLVACDEPVTNLLCQGMVLAEGYYRDVPGGGREWIAPSEVVVERDERARPVRAVHARDGGEVQAAGIGVMSKSKNNGVDPQEMIETYGADVARLYVMFAAPPDQALEWKDDSIKGMQAFLRRLWRLVAEHVAAGPLVEPGPAALDPDQKDVRRKLHQTLQKMGDDIGRRYSFNTAIAAAMELVNALLKFEDASGPGRAVRQEALSALVAALSPIVPHIAHELWLALGHRTAVIDVGYPQADPAALVSDTVKLAVQVNGKLRGQVEVAADATQEQIIAAALMDGNVQKYVDGAPLKKRIVVPGKLVNLVV
jgi:leucyl-tRNA synthetase